MKRLLAAALAVLAILALWFVLARGGGRASGANAPAEEPALPERVVADLRLVPAERSELAPQPAPTHDESAAGAARDSTPPDRDPPVQVRGRVLDAHGQGIPGVALVQSDSRARSDAALAVSGAGGAFALELAVGRAAFDLECAPDAPFATLRAAHVTRDNAAREQLVVAAPAIELAGVVIEAGGGAVPEASVEFQVPMEAFAGFPAPLDTTVARSSFAHSDKDGRFAHLRVPAVEGASLRAWCSGFRTIWGPAPHESRDDVVLELERLAPQEPWLRGLVVSAEGKPVEGAQVRLDSLAARTASDGAFSFEKAWADPDAPLVAALRGFQPAVLPRGGALLQQEFAPAPVRLVLGGAMLAISGRILDAEDQPCRGWRVGLQDGTILTRNSIPFDLAEDLARGEKVATTSDARGAFVLEGLSPREYVVQAYEPSSLLLLRSDSVPAGTRDLVLRVPDDALHARLAGEVVGRDGRPVAGVRVSTRLVTATSGGATSWASGSEAVTDDAGRFELTNVPRRYATLSVDGEAVIPDVFEVDETASAGLHLEVARRCHLRIELAPAGESTAGEGTAPDAVSALDAEGQALQLYTFQGTSWSSTTRLQLSRLGTHPLGVTEDAHTLVFYRGEQELRRAEITLVPDEVAVVRIGGP